MIFLTVVFQRKVKLYNSNVDPQLGGRYILFCVLSFTKGHSNSSGGSRIVSFSFLKRLKLPPAFSLFFKIIVIYLKGLLSCRAQTQNRAVLLQFEVDLVFCSQTFQQHQLLFNAPHLIYKITRCSLQSL